MSLAVTIVGLVMFIIQWRACTPPSTVPPSFLNKHSQGGQAFPRRLQWLLARAARPQVHRSQASRRVLSYA